MESQDFRRSSEISGAYASLERVIGTGLLQQPGNALFECVFTSVLINLNDLLQKADKAGRRVSFDQDVYVHKGSRDVTTLINHARNAACHLTSAVQDLGWGRIRMVTMSGFCPNAMVIGGDTFGCEYSDDTAVQYGPIRVYVKRHVLRAIREVQLVLPNR